MMKTFVALLVLALALGVSAQFDPPSALEAPPPPSFSFSPGYFSPDSPISPIPTSPTSPYSPISYSPVEISVVTIPSAFSYGTGPFSPFTKIPSHLLGSHHNQQVSPLPSLSPFSIPPLAPFAPLFGSHSSDASMLQTSAGVAIACLVVVLAF
mmetsp:Transcript_34214/g.47772  ORF Transcript_34214/g.47772 Transcript_34214/m.47772 type:complete len:153 (-) Transcript_34214:69-527(-)